MNAQFSVITFIAAGVTVFCVWCLAATYSEAGGEIRIQGSKDIRVEAQLEVVAKWLHLQKKLVSSLGLVQVKPGLYL
jgi:hypothetical protein